MRILGIDILFDIYLRNNYDDLKGQSEALSNA